MVISVTSDNVDDFLKVAPETVSLVGVAAIEAANRHVKWVDLDSHGYGVLDITTDRVQMDYYVLSDRTRSGTQKVERVSPRLSGAAELQRRLGVAAEQRGSGTRPKRRRGGARPWGTA